MEGITEQEAFNKVWNHFVVENKPLAMGGGRCLYREKENVSIRCAIGVLIPDELYTEEMEGKGVGSLALHFPELQPYFPDSDFCRRLQTAHDVSRNHSLFVVKLKTIAAEFGLTIPS